MPDDETAQPDEAGQRGFSRRSALKRLGAGAAIAWSAPVILSAGSTAFAAGSLSPNCTSSGGCDPPPNPPGHFPCGGGCATGSCTGGVGCFGVTDTEGQCFCAQGVNGCPCLTVTCTASSQCGPGQHCVVQNYCGGGHCYDCCTVNCH
jgi:hypothetical protein